MRWVAVCAFASVFLASASAQAQDGLGLPPELEAIAGPRDADLRGIATLSIPQGFSYIGERGIVKFLELTGNQPGPSDVGALIARDEWIIYFSYDDIGYVKDDEKDKLDADAILASIREGNDRANEYRRERGMSTLQLVGWDQAPFYDNETKNLTWALRGRSDGRDVINYNSRVLGRGGVMSVNLVCAPEQLATVVPTYRKLLTNNLSYKPGQRYAEWRQGDRVAAYGLTALVAGGGVAVAAKTGLLAKLAKFAKVIIVGIVAAFATLGRFIKGLFGRTDKAGGSQPG